MARSGTITSPSGITPTDAISAATRDEATPPTPLRDVATALPDVSSPEASLSESHLAGSKHDATTHTTGRCDVSTPDVRDVSTPDVRDVGVPDFCDAVAHRAANLFATRQHLCAEAVLRALAEGLGGPLSPEQAAALGTPFCQGMGGAGCTCGALSGGIAGVGLYLGRRCDGASGAPGRRHARLLHDTFRRTFGATCCRVLTKNLDKDAHFAQCQHLTQEAARMAARLLLSEGVRPVDAQGLPGKPDTRLTAWRRRFTALFRRRA